MQEHRFCILSYAALSYAVGNHIVLCIVIGYCVKLQHEVKRTSAELHGDSSRHGGAWCHGGEGLFSTLAT